MADTTSDMTIPCSHTESTSTAILICSTDSMDTSSDDEDQDHHCDEVVEDDEEEDVYIEPRTNRVRDRNARPLLLKDALCKGEEKATCIICLDPLSHPCKHSSPFLNCNCIVSAHSECLHLWLNTKNVCPICHVEARRPLTILRGHNAYSRLYDSDERRNRNRGGVCFGFVCRLTCVSLISFVVWTCLKYGTNQSQE